MGHSQGGLKRFKDLPTAKNLPMAGGRPTLPTGSGNLREGDGRNSILFKRALRVARECESEGELLVKMQIHNEAMCVEPLSDTELLGVVASAWGKTIRGDNWVGREARVTTPASEIMEYAFDPDVLWFKQYLTVNHFPYHEEFAISPKAVAASISWGPDRVRKVVRALQESGVIECVHRGGHRMGDTNKFRFAK